MMKLLNQLFESDLSRRETLMTFSAPFPLPIENGGGTFRIMGANSMFWVLVGFFFVTQSILNVIYSIIVYRFIILGKKPKSSSSSSSSSLSPYLLGYGVLIPTLLIIPFYIVQMFPIQNIAVLAAVGLNPGLMVFRCLEAMHDTVPDFAKENGLKSFVLYYISVIQFDLSTSKPTTTTTTSTTTKKSTTTTTKTTTTNNNSSNNNNNTTLTLTQCFQRKGRAFLRDYILLSIIYSIVLPYSLEPMPTKSNATMTDWLHWGHLCNNYILATITGFVLSSGSLGVGFVTELISGIKTIELSDHALLKSTSPSDFWGRRWNALIGGGLKRGVFLPMQKHNFSKPIAGVTTFLASGIFHEYILILISYCCYTMTLREQQEQQQEVEQPPLIVDDYYVPQYGAHLIFFMWNGVVLLLERLWKHHPMMQWMERNLPKPIRTALVIMTVLPIGHLFTNEYKECGFYTDFSVGFPLIVYDNETS